MYFFFIICHQLDPVASYRNGITVTPKSVKQLACVWLPDVNESVAISRRLQQNHICRFIPL